MSSRKRKGKATFASAESSPDGRDTLSIPLTSEGKRQRMTPQMHSMSTSSATNTTTTTTTTTHIAPLETCALCQTPTEAAHAFRCTAGIHMLCGSCLQTYITASVLSKKSKLLQSGLVIPCPMLAEEHADSSSASSSAAAASSSSASGATRSAITFCVAHFGHESIGRLLTSTAILGTTAFAQTMVTELHHAFLLGARGAARRLPTQPTENASDGSARTKQLHALADEIYKDNAFVCCGGCAYPFVGFDNCNVVTCEIVADPPPGSVLQEQVCGRQQCGICGALHNQDETKENDDAEEDEDGQTVLDRRSHTHGAMHSPTGRSFFFANETRKQIASVLMREQQIADAIQLRACDDGDRMVLLRHLGHLIDTQPEFGSGGPSQLNAARITYLVTMRISRGDDHAQPIPSCKYLFGRIPTSPIPSGSDIGPVDAIEIARERVARTTAMQVQTEWMLAQPPAAMDAVLRAIQVDHEATERRLAEETADAAAAAAVAVAAAVPVGRLDGPLIRIPENLERREFDLGDFDLDDEDDAGEGAVTAEGDAVAMDADEEKQTGPDARLTAAAMEVGRGPTVDSDDDDDDDGHLAIPSSDDDISQYADENNRDSGRRKIITAAIARCSRLSRQTQPVSIGDCNSLIELTVQAAIHCEPSFATMVCARIGIPSLHGVGVIMDAIQIKMRLHPTDTEMCLHALHPRARDIVILAASRLQIPCDQLELMRDLDGLDWWRSAIHGTQRVITRAANTSLPYIEMVVNVILYLFYARSHHGDGGVDAEDALERTRLRTFQFIINFALYQGDDAAQDSLSDRLNILLLRAMHVDPGLRRKHRSVLAWHIRLLPEAKEIGFHAFIESVIAIVLDKIHAMDAPPASGAHILLHAISDVESRLRAEMVVVGQSRSPAQEPPPPPPPPPHHAMLRAPGLDDIEPADIELERVDGDRPLDSVQQNNNGVDAPPDDMYPYVFNYINDHLWRFKDDEFDTSESRMLQRRIVRASMCIIRLNRTEWFTVYAQRHKQSYGNEDALFSPACMDYIRFQAIQLVRDWIDRRGSMDARIDALLDRCIYGNKVVGARLPPSIPGNPPSDNDDDARQAAVSAESVDEPAAAASSSSSAECKRDDEDEKKQDRPDAIIFGRYRVVGSDVWLACDGPMAPPPRCLKLACCLSPVFRARYYDVAKMAGMVDANNEDDAALALSLALTTQSEASMELSQLILWSYECMRDCNDGREITIRGSDATRRALAICREKMPGLLELTIKLRYERFKLRTSVWAYNGLALDLARMVDPAFAATVGSKTHENAIVALCTHLSTMSASRDFSGWCDRHAVMESSGAAGAENDITPQFIPLHFLDCTRDAALRCPSYARRYARFLINACRGAAPFASIAYLFAAHGGYRFRWLQFIREAHELLGHRDNAFVVSHMQQDASGQFAQQLDQLFQRACVVLFPPLSVALARTEGLVRDENDNARWSDDDNDASAPPATAATDRSGGDRLWNLRPSDTSQRLPIQTVLEVCSMACIAPADSLLVYPFHNLIHPATASDELAPTAANNFATSASVVA